MTIEPATKERVGPRLMLVLGCLFFGISITEACSVYVLPLTIKLFTNNPQYIFLILAINPAFGFIAQPLVGIWSDRIWTRWGRRGFFLIICAPVVALTLICIPFISSFAILIIAVVVLQFFQDMLNGSDQPLIADLVPPEQRTFMLGWVKTMENVGFLLVLYVGMTWVTGYKDSHGEEQFGLPLYFTAAACQIVFVMFAAFFLKEKPVEWKDRPKLTPMSYVRDFAQQPMLLRIAMAYFLRAFTRTAVVGSIALYAIQTLGFTEKELGRSWGLMPVIALASGIPLGLLVERFAKHRVLQSAFSAVIVGCIVGYFSGTTTGLSVAAFCFGFGDMMLEVTHKAFMSEHYPKEQIGQLTGAVNIFYATGRTAALVFMGFCIKWVNPNVDWDTVGSTITADYHIIWIVSGLSALMGILILSTVRDLRHEKVKR